MTKALNNPQQKGKTMTRDEAIERIKTALKTKTGRAWSVRGGRGSAWAWITVTAPPKRRNEFGYLNQADRAELAKAFQCDSVHNQGITIAASAAHRREFVNRVEGNAFEVAEAYWD